MCYSYRLPFKEPLKTSARTYNNREGWILCWEELGEYYVGEAAPLPGFIQTNMQDIGNYIQEHINLWVQLLKKEMPVEQFQQHYKAANIPPALQFALDSLAYQVEAQRTNALLEYFLFNNDITNSIAVNGLVSLMNKEHTLTAVRRLVDEGFQTIKCKVGKHFQREKAILSKIRAAFPNLLIRLDANQSWDISEAIDYLAELEPLNIEYCEEPLSTPTPSAFSTLNNKTSIPLALDESINSSDHWPALLPFVSVLVIKPMVIGNFRTLFNISQQSEKANRSLVFTSSLDSSIGRSMTALLASGLGAGGYAHGLNTGNLFSQDIHPNRPLIQQGHIQLDTGILPLKTDIKRLQTISTSTIKSS
ncbi:o-succinylbenzoate synthase [Fodinibius salsisoli]|nr:o-succinylbenzoate synthase [Fodinibius salsisoli]